VSAFSRIVSLAQTSVLLASGDDLYGSVYEKNRLCVPLNQVARSVLTALLAVEDRRFFSHRGLDFRAVARAAYVNIRNLRFVQGGSTLTQQLARIAVLQRAERTFRRKSVEALVALAIERQFNKLQILEAYLNAAYFGHGIHGIELAALAHCGKTAATLNDSDAAYLIGLLKAPARYCRCCDPARAAGRTKLAMRLSGMNTARAEEHSDRSPWRRRPTWTDRLQSTGKYATQLVQRWLKQSLPGYYPAQRLIVRTTIDPRCQIALELACRFVQSTGYSGRLACIVQDVQSGTIKAVSGGVDFRRQEFNSATNGCLQPGSLLKPFILLAALQRGIPLDYKYESRPLTICPKHGRPWSVKNADDRYRGWMTIADALVFSDNTVYAQFVKGGVKLDHWGGGKLDQMSVWEWGLAVSVASGAEACGPVCGPRLGRSGRRHTPREMWW
jgi:penicillin-binding protein 1A